MKDSLKRCAYRQHHFRLWQDQSLHGLLLLRLLIILGILVEFFQNWGSVQPN